jgi:adenosylmethionine-8-amino-7-oxononanoate aminotransferase
MGNTVYFMPPYVITEKEMQMLVERTLTVIDSLS